MSDKPTYEEVVEALRRLEIEASKAGDALSKMGRGATMMGLACRNARVLLSRAQQKD